MHIPFTKRCSSCRYTITKQKKETRADASNGSQSRSSPALSVFTVHFYFKQLNKLL